MLDGVIEFCGRGKPTGGEAFDERGAQQVGQQAGLPQEGSLALAERQGGSAAEMMHPGHVAGEDSTAHRPAGEKASSRNTNLLKPQAPPPLWSHSAESLRMVPQHGESERRESRVIALIERQVPVF